MPEQNTREKAIRGKMVSDGLGTAPLTVFFVPCIIVAFAAAVSVQNAPRRAKACPELPTAVALC